MNLVIYRVRVLDLCLIDGRPTCEIVIGDGIFCYKQPTMLDNFQ
jgi:hypothetical protein